MGVRQTPERHEYGRWQLKVFPDTDTATLLIENVNREGEHWLTLATYEAPHSPIGFVRLRPFMEDRHTFELGPVHTNALHRR